MAASPSVHEHWSSRFAFLMAAIGSSVGLGNFWRFPYTAGEGGGAAFIIIYLVCVALVAYPVLVAEYGVGRRAGLSAVGSTAAIAKESGASPAWGIVGWVGMVAIFLILTFYSVIAGWILSYVPMTFTGYFDTLWADAPGDAARLFADAGFAPTCQAVFEARETLNGDALADALSTIGEVAPTHAMAVCGASYDALVGVGASGADVSQRFWAVAGDPGFERTCAAAFASGQYPATDAGLLCDTTRQTIMASGVTDQFLRYVPGSPRFDAFPVAAAHTIFMAVTTLVVARGLKGGIEWVVQILMPLFFVMLVGIVIYAAIVGDFASAAAFLFTPDFTKVSPAIVQSALGQAFFSIGVGGALMVTYGAYLQKNQNIPRSSGVIAGADTAVAIIAGLAIFPFVFAFALEPSAGPGLFFVTLPNAFAQMPAGALVGGAFFLLALFAALTSSISLLEVATSWAEERPPFNSRLRAAVTLGILAWVIGMGSVLLPGFLDVVDAITGKIMLPLGGLLVAILVGWVVKKEIMREELGAGAGSLGGFFPVWHFLVRWVSVIGITVILILGTLEWLAPDLYASLF